MNLFKQKRFWLGIGLTALFLWLVFRQVDYASLTQALFNADYRWLFPALAIYLAGYWLRAICWKYLINSIKPLPWQELMPPMILGFMVNNVLPARAGEFVRAYVVGKKQNISKSSVFATVLMQRIFDGLVMVLLAAVVLYLFNFPRTASNAEFVRMVNNVVDITSVLFAAGFCGLFLTMTFKERAIRLISRVLHILPAGLREKADRMLQSFIAGFAVIRSRRDSLRVFAFTLIAWLCESAAYYFIMLAFHIQLPVYTAVMLMSIVNLGIMIPSSPGYIGPFEFFGVGTLQLFGVAKSMALPCILVIHTIVWLPITLWGFYYMWTLHLSFKEMEAVVPAGESGEATHAR